MPFAKTLLLGAALLGLTAVPAVAGHHHAHRTVVSCRCVVVHQRHAVRRVAHHRVSHSWRRVVRVSDDGMGENAGGWGGRYDLHERSYETASYSRFDEWRHDQAPACRHLSDRDWDHDWDHHGGRRLRLCPGEGELTLNSYSLDGGVGGFPEVGFGGGGGGGFAEAGASASAFASASASASVSVRFHGGGGHHGGHMMKHGCGCGGHGR